MLEIMEIHNCYHHNKWPWGRTVTIITEDGDATVEMAFDNENPGICYISGLSVNLHRRREGIATRLMKECIEYCSSEQLETRDNRIFRIDLNSTMEPFVLNFYHKLGFKDTKEKDGFMYMYKLLI